MVKARHRAPFDLDFRQTSSNQRGFDSGVDHKCIWDDYNGYRWYRDSDVYGDRNAYEDSKVRKSERVSKVLAWYDVYSCPEVLHNK